MSLRKRRREQAFPEDAHISDAAYEAPAGENTLTEEKAALTQKQREEKEREVWEAIREAHYEAIEQLPLTLQRQLFLMRQLDEQSININSKLLPALQKYIKLREEIALRPESEPATAEKTEELPANQNHEETNSVPSVHDIADEDTQPNPPSGSPMKVSPEKSPRPSTPSSVLPVSIHPHSNEPKGTTREILSQVAQMSEELLRASQEKVNLAQANHDSVERHIRLLDQAIKEQEASIALDKVQNNTGIGIVLPELSAPEYRKKAENRPTDDYDLDLMLNGDPTAQEAQPETAKKVSHPKKRKGKEKRRRSQSSAQDSSSLTITLPAPEIVNPTEQVYCYCSRVSFGEMIGCDNESCEREWFHLGCVGLTEIPTGEWYCEDCREDV